MSGPRSSGSGGSISGGWRSSPAGRSRSVRCSGVPLIGLPGNPVAAALTFAILARPLILRLAGAAAAPPLTLSGRGRLRLPQEAGPARISARQPRARRRRASSPANIQRDGAGILSSIVQSDGFAILDESMSDLAPGTIVDFLPFSEVFGS